MCLFVPHVESQALCQEQRQDDHHVPLGGSTLNDVISAGIKVTEGFHESSCEEPPI